MKHSLFLAACALSLSACTSTPKLTPQQLEAQRFSTLAVYSDNRVGMKSSTDWFWMTAPGRVLALEIGGRAYNVKDVESIQRSQRNVIVARLSNGTEINSHPDNVFWLNCDHSKSCRYSLNASRSDWKKDLGGALKRMEIAKLSKPDTIKHGRSKMVGDPRSAIRDDYAAAPDLNEVGARVDILKESEFAQLLDRVAKVLRDWDGKEPERKAQAAREREEWEASIKRRHEELRSAPIGTPAYCERALQNELPKDAVLDCPNHGGRFFSISSFEKAGWNVVSVNTSPIVDSIGQPFTMYRISFQKVR